METEKNVYYAQEIISSISNLFKDIDEEKSYCYIDTKEFEEGDNLTQFFIGYLKAGTVLYNQLTGNQTNNFEFTHILNQLCVQDLLKDSDLLKE